MKIGLILLVLCAVSCASGFYSSTPPREGMEARIDRRLVLKHKGPDEKEKIVISKHRPGRVVHVGSRVVTVRFQPKHHRAEVDLEFGDYLSESSGFYLIGVEQIDLNGRSYRTRYRERKYSFWDDLLNMEDEFGDGANGWVDAPPPQLVW